MSDIEEKLYVIHAEARETGTVTPGTRSKIRNWNDLHELPW